MRDVLLPLLLLVLAASASLAGAPARADEPRLPVDHIVSAMRAGTQRVCEAARDPLPPTATELEREMRRLEADETCGCELPAIDEAAAALRRAAIEGRATRAMWQQAMAPQRDRCYARLARAMYEGRACVLMPDADPRLAGVDRVAYCDCMRRGVSRLDDDAMMRGLAGSRASGPGDAPMVQVELECRRTAARPH